MIVQHGIAEKMVRRGTTVGSAWDHEERRSRGNGFIGTIPEKDCVLAMIPVRSMRTVRMRDTYRFRFGIGREVNRSSGVPEEALEISRRAWKEQRI